MIFNSIFQPPPGVTLQQQRNGSIIIQYHVNDRISVRNALLAVAANINRDIQTQVEQEKQAEAARKRIPLTKADLLQQTQAQLQNDQATIEAATEMTDELPSDITQFVEQRNSPPAPQSVPAAQHLMPVASPPAMAQPSPTGIAPAILPAPPIPSDHNFPPASTPVQVGKVQRF